MPAGRPRKPDALRNLQGRDHNRPLEGVEVKIPVQTFATCPDWLPEVAKTEWRRQVPYMIKSRLLTPVDRATLANYCLGWAGIREEQECINKEGSTETIRTATGKHVKPSAHMTNLKTYFDIMSKSARELGITPSSRASIRLPKVPEKTGIDLLRPPQWIPPKMIKEKKK